MCLCIARELGALAVTAQRDTAALSEGLEDGAEIESNLNSKTSDRIDLSTVVDGVGVDRDVDIDSVAPSGIDLNDRSTSVHDESTVAVVRTLARPDKVPAELNIVHTEDVGEIPAERTPAVILETLKITPLNTLRDCTSPISVVVDNRLAILDNFPNGLADGNDGGNIDVLRNTTTLGQGAASNLLRITSGNSKADASETERLLILGCSKAGQSHNGKDDVLHLVIWFGGRKLLQIP